MYQTLRHTTLRKYLTGSIALLLMLTVLPFSAGAQSKSQLEKERTQLEREIRNLNSQLSKARNNAKLTDRQLASLNKQIKERNRLINNINGQLNLISIQISSTQDSINTIRSRVDSLKKEYAHVTRVLYRERDNLSKVSLLFSTEDYNRAYLRHKYFDAYSRYRRLQARAIEEHVSNLQMLNSALVQQRNEKNSLLSEEKKHKEALAKEQKQKQKNQRDSKQQQQELRKQLKQKEKRKQQLQQQIQRIINEEVAKANKRKSEGKTNTVTPAPNANNKKGNKNASAAKTQPTPSPSNDPMTQSFANAKGSMPWPVSFTKVTREFGKQTHKTGVSCDNYGIEGMTAPGAVVRCVHEGEVTVVMPDQWGTKLVVVTHGDYRTVYTSLGTVSVKRGTKVKEGQSLGTVYIWEDNTSTFEFQVRYNTTAQNPRSWLK